MEESETVPLTKADNIQGINNATYDSTERCCVRTKSTNNENITLGEWICENLSRDCDTYGKIAFQGINRKSMAKFIRLPLSDVDGRFDSVFRFMTEKWKVEPPSLIVSVTGGARNFDIDNEVLAHFKGIILKISQTPGAWVISGGTHAGVMKHVGDALREESAAICVGIPTWGVIKDKEKLLSPQNLSSGKICQYHVGAWLKAKYAYLNPNHNHFLLVDDGTTGKYGGEIKFRADFERYITENYGAPFVLVVLNGGIGTFNTVYETVAGGKKGFPVVLVKGSGRVADLFSDMVLEGKDWQETDDILLKEELKKIVDIDIKWRACVKKKELGLLIVAKTEDAQSINDAIMNALLSGNQKESGRMSTFEYLRLALLWDKPHILRKVLPVNRPETFNDTVEVCGPCGESTERKKPKKISFEELEHLLVMALARGNVNFVQLLLIEYEIDIQEVLTMDVLELLYGYQSHEKNFPSTFVELIEMNYNSMSLYTDEQIMYMSTIYQYSTNWDIEDGKCSLNSNGIHKLRMEFFGNVKVEGSTTTNISADKKLKNPLWELFIWATVCNLPDMAKFLWRFEGDHIAKSLLAYKFWGDLANDDTRYHEQKLKLFRESKETFKLYATDLLEECYDQNEKKATKLITTTLDQVPGKTCLELAVDIRHQEFVAHTCAQNVLTDVWTGKMQLQEVKMKDYLKILIAIFLPFLIPLWYKFQRPKVRPNEKCEHADRSHPMLASEDTQLYHASWKDIKDFYCNTPVVRFLMHFVSFLAFLILYSYVVLRNRLQDYELATTEIVLYAIALGHLTSEIYQVTQYDEEKVVKKLEIWISDKYNRYDVFLLTLFIIAASLRLSEKTCDVAHTLHAVNCGFWILRITTALRVSSTFGAYLEMVHTMMGNLKDFLLILVFAILAYGVMSTSLLYPGGSFEQQILTIVMRPWFHIYGDNFVEIESSSNSTTHFNTPKYNSFDEYIVWLFQGFYLILTNILLLNIIIAIFNTSYVEVIKQGSKTWKFERYFMIVEYSQRVNAPPPFCIIAHLYLLIQHLIALCCPCICTPTKWSNMELKKTSTNVDEKVKLAQFECDCAILVHKRRREMIDKTAAGASELELNTKEIKDIKETVEALEKDKDKTKTAIEGLEKDMKDKMTILEEILKLVKK